jgi:hypothetical protein
MVVCCQSRIAGDEYTANNNLGTSLVVEDEDDEDGEEGLRGLLIVFIIQQRYYSIRNCNK